MELRTVIPRERADVFLDSGMRIGFVERSNGRWSAYRVAWYVGGEGSGYDVLPNPRIIHNETMEPVVYSYEMGAHFRQFRFTSRRKAAQAVMDSLQWW